jgi:hypothetical protein
MGISGQRHVPAALSSRLKDIRYPLYGSLGGPWALSVLNCFEVGYELDYRAIEVRFPEEAREFIL